MKLYGPRQAVLVTCRGKVEILGRVKEKDNIISVAWHTPLSVEPFMYAIAVGKTRFSLKLIKESGVFAVNFISKKMQEEVVYCGRHSGEHLDKFSETGLKKEECEKIDCPRLADALGYLECEVVDEIETGDHVLFIAKVINSKLEKEDKRLFHITGNEFTTTTD